MVNKIVKKMIACGLAGTLLLSGTEVISVSAEEISNLEEQMVDDAETLIIPSGDEESDKVDEEIVEEESQEDEVQETVDGLSQVEISETTDFLDDDGVTHVSDETALKTALENGGTVVLDADIACSKSLNVKNDPVRLMLNGHSITASSRIIEIEKDMIIEGEGTISGYGIYINDTAATPQKITVQLLGGTITENIRGKFCELDINLKFPIICCHYT